MSPHKYHLQSGHLPACLYSSILVIMNYRRNKSSKLGSTRSLTNVKMFCTVRSTREFSKLSATGSSNARNTEQVPCIFMEGRKPPPLLQPPMMPASSDPHLSGACSCPATPRPKVSYGRGSNFFFVPSAPASWHLQRAGAGRFGQGRAPFARSLAAQRRPLTGSSGPCETVA